MNTGNPVMDVVFWTMVATGGVSIVYMLADGLFWKSSGPAKIKEKPWPDMFWKGSLAERKKVAAALWSLEAKEM